MDEMNLLSETFDLYYKKAKQSLDKGDKSLAKKYYMLAAEQMLKMAKQSDGQLQKTRYRRAKSIVEFAENIGAEKRTAKGEEEETGGNVSVSKNDKITLEEALKRLNELEGLGTVKKKVSDWVDQIKVFRLRKQRGLPVPDMSYHLVFTGNPGTGKTTVARLMAQIYCALGVLKEGHLVEVDRSGLVAGYVGQTAVKTKDVLKKAYGGVLFIDEAYSLVGGGSNDFGQEAIDAVLKEMEDKRDNLVVIVAGYDKPMEKFISSNPGLRSRFKNFIHFPDYTGEELYNIFARMCAKDSYAPDADTGRALGLYFRKMYEKRNENFGNGRDVRNLYETIVTAQSGRVARMSDPTDAEMTTLTLSDLPDAIFEIDVEEAALSPSNRTDGLADAKIKRAEKPQTPEDKVLEESGGALFDYKFDWDSLPVIDFDDIAGLDEVKEVVRVKVLLPLTNPEVFEGYVRKSGGGLLLYGPPGTGKTMIAAAIANEIGAKFCSVKPSDLLNQGVGNTEKAVRALFAQAREFPCAVIYFDEMDSISPKSTKSQYAKQLRSELLSQLQGIESYGKKTDNILFLIAATNKPWDVDSAFVRPGRFGTRVYVGLPDKDAREYMINRRLDKIREKGIVAVEADMDVLSAVEKTNGFNGSDITALLDKAEELSALRAVETGEKTLKNEDLEKAFEHVTSSVQSGDIEKLLAWKAQND
jgi:SpoVK/Ycf46/Vps4 family AAA+-type ATPase